MEESKKRALTPFHDVMTDIFSRPPMDENERKLRLAVLQGRIDYHVAAKNLLGINYRLTGDEESLKLAQDNGKFLEFFKRLCNLQNEKWEDRDSYRLRVAILWLALSGAFEQGDAVFESSMNMSEAEKVNAQLLAEGLDPDAMEEDIKNFFK